MTPWIGRVPAVIEAWYPGQEGGTALAEILFGDVNPSGHLAATFEKHWEDNPTHDSYYPSEKGSNKVIYKEGIFVGYRGYEHNGTKPLFPFGYGLSYFCVIRRFVAEDSKQRVGGGRARSERHITITAS